MRTKMAAIVLIAIFAVMALQHQASGECITVPLKDEPAPDPVEFVGIFGQRGTTANQQCVGGNCAVNQMPIPLGVPNFQPMARTEPREMRSVLVQSPRQVSYAVEQRSRVFSRIRSLFSRWIDCRR